MAKVSVEVSAEVLVSVRFRTEVEETTSMAEVKKHAQEASERVAQSVVGLRGDTASATVQRVVSFTTRLM